LEVGLDGKNVSDIDLRVLEQELRADAEAQQKQKLDLEEFMMETWGHARLPIKGGGACFWRVIAVLIKLMKDKVVMPHMIYANVLHGMITEEAGLSADEESMMTQMMEGGYNTEVSTDVMTPNPNPNVC
jgi:hypothetical protein